MSRSIVVYWTVNENVNYEKYSELAYQSPNYPISKHLREKFSHLEKKDDVLNYFKCPASSKSLRNIFGIRAHKDYHIEKIGKAYSSSDIDKEDFTRNVFLRYSSENFISLKWSLLFFSEEDLEMEMLPAYLENNDFVDSTTLFPGNFNISKWFRGVEPTFILNKKRLEIKKNDVLYYLKFKTDKKIIFKNFQFTEDTHNLLRSTIGYKMTQKNSPLSKLYKLFTDKLYHKRLAKIIKDNLTGY